jgi:hypothetical protein
MSFFSASSALGIPTNISTVDPQNVEYVLKGSIYWNEFIKSCTLIFHLI